ncbi:MAG TPA: hypothetical protein VIV60_21395 [Polyangiaceae bacterium]
MATVYALHAELQANIDDLAATFGIRSYRTENRRAKWLTCRQNSSAAVATCGEPAADAPILVYGGRAGPPAGN